MSFSLTRWSTACGSSSGHWLVRDLPGAALIRFRDQGWALVPIKPDSELWLARRPGSACWPERFDDQQLVDLLRAHPRLRVWYRSRREALHQLEAAWVGREASALSQLVG